MGINIRKEFIKTGCELLKNVELDKEQEKSLCDDIMMLVGRYVNVVEVNAPKLEKEARNGN